MNPCSIVKASWSTFASGVAQFVVQEALEMIRWRCGWYAASLKCAQPLRTDAECLCFDGHFFGQPAEERIELEQVCHRLDVAKIV
jgi:hypothetical protein